jgi:antitoxin component YwqK of YwqJK toxin-antitoxin module
MRYLIILLLLASVNSNAQWKSYVIGAKRDTLNRVDLKGLKQGPWTVHVDPLRGEDGYDEEGFYKDDKKEGTWRRFSPEGDLVAIENYYYGMKTGKNRYFLHTGELLREESWRAIDPKNPYDTIAVTDVNDPSKIVERRIIKVEPNSYKHGTWTYYNTESGTIANTEEWVMNKRKEEVLTGTEDDLAPIDITKNGSTVKNNKTSEEKDDKKVTKPKEVMDFEKKNSGKKKIKVRDGNTGG